MPSFLLSRYTQVGFNFVSVKCEAQLSFCCRVLLDQSFPKNVSVHKKTPSLPEVLDGVVELHLRVEELDGLVRKLDPQLLVLGGPLLKVEDQLLEPGLGHGTAVLVALDAVNMLLDGAPGEQK